MRDRVERQKVERRIRWFGATPPDAGEDPRRKDDQDDQDDGPDEAPETPTNEPPPTPVKDPPPDGGPPTPYVV